MTVDAETAPRAARRGSLVEWLTMAPDAGPALKPRDMMAHCCTLLTEFDARVQLLREEYPEEEAMIRSVATAALARVTEAVQAPRAERRRRQSLRLLAQDEGDEDEDDMEDGEAGDIVATEAAADDHGPAGAEKDSEEAAKEVGATAGTGPSGGDLTKEDVPQKDTRAEDTVMVVRPARARGFTFEQRSTVATAVCGKRRGAALGAGAVKLRKNPAFVFVAFVGGGFSTLGLFAAAYMGAEVPAWAYALTAAITIIVWWSLVPLMSSAVAGQLLRCFDAWILLLNLYAAASCAALTIADPAAAAFVATIAIGCAPVIVFTDALPGAFRKAVQRGALLASAVAASVAPVVAFADALDGVEDVVVERRGMKWSATSQMLSCSATAATYCVRFFLTSMKNPQDLALLKSRMRCVRMPRALAEQRAAFEAQMDEVVERQARAARAAGPTRQTEATTVPAGAAAYETRVGAAQCVGSVATASAMN